MVSQNCKKPNRVRSDGLETAPAAAKNAVLMDLWQYEAVIGARMFYGKAGFEATKIANCVLGYERSQAATKLKSGNYLGHLSWYRFLRENVVLPLPNVNQSLTAREFYWRFKSWFQHRNRDVIYAPSQKMFGAYLRFSGFKKAISAGRTVYPGIKLIERN